MKMSYSKDIISILPKKEDIMAEKDIIMVSQKELRQLHVIRKVLDRQLKQIEAADIFVAIR